MRNAVVSFVVIGVIAAAGGYVVGLHSQPQYERQAVVGAPTLNTLLTAGWEIERGDPEIRGAIVYAMRRPKP